MSSTFGLSSLERPNVADRAGAYALRCARSARTGGPVAGSSGCTSRNAPALTATSPNARRPPSGPGSPSTVTATTMSKAWRARLPARRPARFHREAQHPAPAAEQEAHRMRRTAQPEARHRGRGSMLRQIAEVRERGRRQRQSETHAGMAEDDRFARTPVLVEDLRPVARRDRRHALPPVFPRLLHVHGFSAGRVEGQAGLLIRDNDLRRARRGRAPLGRARRAGVVGSVGVDQRAHGAQGDSLAPSQPITASRSGMFTDAASARLGRPCPSARRPRYATGFRPAGTCALCRPE
jgi:hypothetical protein